jgi:hypothetical protein
MAKRFPWVWVVALIVFIAIAIVLNRTEDKTTPTTVPDQGTAEAVPTTEFLFPADEGVVTSILIEGRDGKMIAFERQGDVWMATKPTTAETTPGAVEAAASQVTALPIQDSLDLAPTDVGLNTPSYTITVGYSSGKFFIVQVGDQTPTSNGYYARKDGGPVLVVSTYDIGILLDMLTTPPLAATATPAATEPLTVAPTGSETTATATKAP